jgi:hypothetical protein
VWNVTRHAFLGDRGEIMTGTAAPRDGRATEVLVELESHATSTKWSEAS